LFGVSQRLQNLPRLWLDAVLDQGMQIDYTNMFLAPLRPYVDNFGPVVVLILLVALAGFCLARAWTTRQQEGGIWAVWGVGGVIVTLLGCIVYVQAVQSLGQGLIALGFLVLWIAGHSGGGRRRPRRLR
jgi:multidrug transporter EmrE-like cation transporter